MRRVAVLVLAVVLLPALPARADGPATTTGAHPQAAMAAPATADASTAADHIDPKMAKDVRRLLVLSGTPTLAMSVVHRMIATFRRMMPNVPSAFWDGFEKRINPQDLVDLMVPVYAHHLSRKEVRALIRFYESKTGRTLVKAMPAITADSQAAATRFSMKISQEAITELKAKGYHHP